MDIQKSLKLITEYIDLGLFSSADDHCSLMLSSRKLGQFETVCTLEKMIDALILKEEYRRAIMYVGNAIQTLGSSKSDSISAQYASLKFKEANCFMKLRDYASSLKSLEAIPHMHRTLQVSLLLVNCYKLSNMKRQACSVQLQVLKHLPMSTEIIEDLINANVSSRDILKVLHQSNMLSNTSGVSSAYIDLNMMSMIVGALEAKKNLHYNEAKSKFDKLLHVYPGNRFVLKHAAECYALSGHSKEAMIVYQQLHTQDPLYMHRLDTWGFLLYEQYEKDGDKLSELYKLASNMMAISGGNSSNSDRKEKSRSNVSNQPESWVLAAMFAATQCDSRKTILFLEKAIAADPRHYMAYLFKGKFLASTDHFEKATIAYMMANSIFKTIYGYTGLVLAHLKCKDTREAGIAAKEAVTVFPGLAKSYILQATVLLDSLKNSDEYFTVVSNRKTIENDIMKTLDKAFAIDPVNVEVCLMKTEILLSKPSNVGIEEAITCLKNCLQHSSSPMIRMKLGKALGMAGKHEEAIQILHLAVSLDSHNTTGAIEELENIEKLLIDAKKGDSNDFINSEYNHLMQNPGNGDSSGNNHGNNFSFPSVFDAQEIGQYEEYNETDEEELGGVLMNSDDSYASDT